MQKHEHNFGHNAMFSGVTLKSIMLVFLSIIYLTLALMPSLTNKQVVTVFVKLRVIA